MATILIAIMQKFCTYFWFCLYVGNDTTYYVTINSLTARQSY